MSHAGLLHCGSCTTRTPERKRAESKLVTAKPNQRAENEHPENDSEICATVRLNDEVIDLGEYNIGDDTTLMMTAIVQPSTKMVADDFEPRELMMTPCRPSHVRDDFTPEPVERVPRLWGE